MTLRQLKRLVDWAERRAVEPPPRPRIAVRYQRDDEVEYSREEASYYRQRQDYRFLALVLSVFGLGWWYGGDHE